MTWRNLQLNNRDCTQDEIVLSLFRDRSVRYRGRDQEFQKRLTLDPASPHLVAVVNESVWLSDLIKFIREELSQPTATFYFGVNRYLIQGNDTNLVLDPTIASGAQIIEVMSRTVSQLGYQVTQSGFFDQDRGRHFNFAQPVTYIYGTQGSNL